MDMMDRMEAIRLANYLKLNSTHIDNQVTGKTRATKRTNVHIMCVIRREQTYILCV